MSEITLSYDIFTNRNRCWDVENFMEETWTSQAMAVVLPAHSSVVDFRTVVLLNTHVIMKKLSGDITWNILFDRL